MKLLLIIILGLNATPGCVSYVKGKVKEKEKECLAVKMKKAQQFELVPSAVMIAF